MERQKTGEQDDAKEGIKETREGLENSEGNEEETRPCIKRREARQELKSKRGKQGKRTRLGTKPQLLPDPRIGID